MNDQISNLLDLVKNGEYKVQNKERNLTPTNKHKYGE